MFKLLRDNAPAGAELHEVAVVGKDLGGSRFLYDGPIGNPGMNTLHRNPAHHRESGTDVRAIEAQTLPACDILKVDTEGCEREIIDSYPHLAGCTAVLVEWHTQDDYQYLIRKLRGAGFALVGDKSAGKHTGEQELLFVRQDRLPAELRGIAKKLAGPRDVAKGPTIHELLPESDEMVGWAIVSSGTENFVGKLIDFDAASPVVTLDPYYVMSHMQLVVVQVPGRPPQAAPAQAEEVQTAYGWIPGGPNRVRWTSYRPCETMSEQARARLYAMIQAGLMKAVNAGQAVTESLAVRG